MQAGTPPRRKAPFNCLTLRLFLAEIKTRSDIRSAVLSPVHVQFCFLENQPLSS